MALVGRRPWLIDLPDGPLSSRASAATRQGAHGRRGGRTRYHWTPCPLCIQCRGPLLPRPRAHVDAVSQYGVHISVPGISGHGPTALPCINLFNY
jgi:hypothetical protein